MLCNQVFYRIYNGFLDKINSSRYLEDRNSDMIKEQYFKSLNQIRIL